VAERGGIFPETRHSAVMLARSPDPIVRERSRALLAAAYYRPVYMHLRLRWRKSPEEAMDLVQAFFLAEAEHDIFAGYDASRARFRTYVRVCLDRLVARIARDGRRQKRGDGAQTLSFDNEGIEREVAALKDDVDVEGTFDREWTRQLFASSIDALRAGLEATNRAHVFAVFERYDLHTSDAPRPTYAEIAAERGVKVTDVTNYLHAARRELRRALLGRLREVTASDEEFAEEARALGLD
jgi:RNA polymerase sigma factor (sigma-70 family)